MAQAQPRGIYPDIRQFVCTNANKEPIDPQTCKLIDPHDPSNHMTHTQAASRGHEVAFVLTEGDPYFVVDLDKCRDPVTGEYNPTAYRWHKALAGAGVEVSRSETGLHFVGRCDAGMSDTYMNKADGYEFYQAGRYIILGSMGQGGSEMDCTAALREHLRPRPVGDQLSLPVEGPVPEWDGYTDDAALIKAAAGSRGSIARLMGEKASFKELWFCHNDAALAKHYPHPKDIFDRSSAEAALCAHLAFWTGKDCARIERLFVKSPLALDRLARCPHPTNKHKIQRPKYLSETVRGAAAITNAVFTFQKGANWR